MAALNITFCDAKAVSTSFRDAFDLLLGVEATFAIAVGGRLIYTEPSFPIVELRAALEDWLTSGPHVDFEFESMEADEPDLVWIRRQLSGGWRAGSAFQDDIAPDELTWAEVSSGCRDFIDAVDRWVRTNLNVEVADVLAR
jgi:hypothetical protein